MAAFNEVGGVPAHASRYLMTDILRHEWGFAGLVVSDYTGVKELLAHGIAASPAEAAARALEAGVDIDMMSGFYLHDLPAAAKAGRVDMATIDEAVRRVLRAKTQVGLFEDPYRYSDPERQKAQNLQ